MISSEMLLRQLIRESLLNEAILDTIKTGIGKTYDFAADVIGVEKPKSGLLGYLDSLSSGEKAEQSGDDHTHSYGYSSPQTSGYTPSTSPYVTQKTGVMATPGNIKALIIGDSQAGSNLGKELAGRLESKKVSVKTVSEVGRSGDQIASRLDGEIDDFDIVIAMFGGNDQSPESASVAIERMYQICKREGAHLIVVGPPPATKITDIELAKRIFGDQITDENYYIRKDGGSYAQNRIEISEEIDNDSQGRDGLSGFGIAARIPIEEYPDQPDGIHCNVGAAEISEKILDSVKIDQIISKIGATMAASLPAPPAYSSDSVSPGISPAAMPGSTENEIEFSGGSHPVTDLIRSRNTIKELNETHFRIMEIIESVLQTEGFTQMAIVAAIANAWHESKLKPGAINHKEGRGRKSVGLFQLLDTGAGRGMTVSERQDPVINTRRIADSAKKTEFMRYMREYPDDPRVLSAAFVVLVERPKRWATSRYSRAVTAGDLVGISGPLPGIIGSINLRARRKKNS